MVPKTIRRPLGRLRRRERRTRLAGGAARLVAASAAALALACLADWWIDMRRETPYLLRVATVAGQIGLAAVLVVVWLLAPLVRRRSYDQLALFVEARR